MKRILPAALLLICFSCLTEESADVGKGSTFLRYYNGGFDDFAESFEVVNDGFIILATTQITNNNVTVQRSKIKLIRTDRYGNIVWQTLYPAFGDNTNKSYFKGRGMLLEKNGDQVVGYTIVGDSIDRNTGTSYLYLMQADANGNFTRGKALVDTNGQLIPNVEGQAVTKDNNEDYLVLGSRSNSTEDMVLAKLDKNNFSLDWLEDYGVGGSNFVTGLMSDNENTIFWGGTVKKNDNPTEIRFIKTEQYATGTIFDREYGTSESNEEVAGICYSTFGPRFHMIGTTDLNGNKDILYKQVSTDGTELFSKVIEDTEAHPEEGNAICTTSDGGVLIVGTSGLDDERDYYLIKLNLLGEVEWSSIFGSSKADQGVSIKQISNGSYVILGATTLGGLNGIMLMKTDANGNIE